DGGRQVFPADARGNRQALVVPGVFGVKPDVGVQTRPLVVRRVDGREAGRKPVSEHHVAVAVLIHAGAKRSEGVLKSELDLMGAGHVRAGGSEKVPAALELLIAPRSEIAP